MNPVEYLRARDQFTPPRVTPLSGGVSGETVLVEVAAERLVVKRALDKLLVAGDWTAKPERAMTEAAALDLLHGLTPDHTPVLRGADPERHTIVMTAAPAEWVSWQLVLLGDLADPSGGVAATATSLGEILGTWHERTWHDAAVAERFADYEAFDQLRVDPFHRRVAKAHPAVARLVQELGDELLLRRDCLVHGDFSPKNVLVGADGLMVLDFEVSHVGASVFDLAFLNCHLALKAMHQPHRATEFAEAARAFLAAYRDAVSTPLPERLGWHTACLLLARVDGLSPVRYLSATTAERVRRMALALLADDDPSAAEVWRRVMEDTA